jgi:hypothetical protein
MKRGTLFLLALLTAFVLPAGIYVAQSAVPAIQYDAVDFLKPPASVSIGEVAGVATNSKGQVLVYTRTGSLNVTVGTARAFGHGPSRLLQFDQNGKLVNEFGEGLYALTYAQSVRVDQQDNIWIVDQYSNMVVKFDPEGRVLMTFGRRPETASSVTANVGAAAARGGGAVAGGAGAAVPRGGAGAAGIGAATGATRGGEVLGPPTAAGGGAGARGGAAPQGGAAPAQGAAAPRGGGRGSPGAGTAGDSFNRPTDVAWDAAGNIFITDGFGNNSRILKMDKNGRFVKTFGSTGSDNGQLNKPASIAIDAKGDVYIADKGNNRIQVFTNDGVFKTQFANVGTPSAICISPGAHQYLFSSNSNDSDNLEHGEIYKMELDGTIIGKFGTAGHLVKEFGTVNALDCPSENTLFIGELLNWRVQKVTLRK